MGLLPAYFPDAHKLLLDFIVDQMDKGSYHWETDFQGLSALGV